MAQFALMANAAAAPHVEQMNRQFQAVAAAVAAQVERLNRQAQDAVAAFDAQFEEISREIVDALNTHMVTIPVPRLEIFRESLDQMSTDLQETLERVRTTEIPYNPQPIPVRVGEMVAPVPQPSVPDRAQSILDQVIAGLVVLAVWYTIVWYAQTGRWVFEVVFCYLLQLFE